MNILTDIKVSGEVFAMYTYLTFDFLFKNTDENSAYAEFCFALPKNSVVSSAKIFLKDKNINMSVVSYSHAAAMDVGTDVLRKLDDNRYSLKIGIETEEVCRLRIRLYVPIDNELTIPLVCDGADAEVLLSMRGVDTVSSRTHELKITRETERLTVCTGQIKADRDFNIRIVPQRRGNFAIAESDIMGGKMICRVRYDVQLAQKYKNILMICDKSTLFGGAYSAARELIYEMAKLWNGRVLVADTDGALIFDGDKASYLAEVLSRENKIGRIEAEKYTEPETLSVIICGAENSIDMSEDCCVITLGARCSDKVKCRVHEHIYGRDDIGQRASEILSRFTAPDIKAEARENGADIKVMRAGEGFCDLFVCYFGDIPPTDFVLDINGRASYAKADISEIYESFRGIELAYAHLLCAELEKKIGYCVPDEIFEIREKLENIGKKYSMLNSETVLAAEIGDRIFPIRVMVSDNVYTDVFKERISVFREDEAALTASELSAVRNQCLEVVLMHIRACGGIFTSGELDVRMQKYQTLVCCLALSAAGLLEEYKTDEAIKFIDGFCHNGLRFTKNRFEASEIMKKMFGSERIIYEGIPDILTACRVLWQTSRKNNSIFC